MTHLTQKQTEFPDVFFVTAHRGNHLPPRVWESYQQVPQGAHVSLPGSLQQPSLGRQMRPPHPPQHFSAEHGRTRVERRLPAAVTQGHISTGPQEPLSHLLATPAGTHEVKEEGHVGDFYW